MMKRELAEEIEQQYFDSVDITTPEENDDDWFGVRG